jgi:outer membrane murein-binding lipoprotein Lpp
MNPLWWIAWSAICAVGTGVLVYFVMQSRMEVLLARQREELAAARAALGAEKDALEASLKAAGETARRIAMDEFMADIRVEERHYVREQKILFVTRKSMVRQERIFFRNIPLSSWVEQEMPYEEGADMEKLARGMSVFAGELLDAPKGPVRKLLH